MLDFLYKIALVPHDLIKYLHKLFAGIIQEPGFLVFDQFGITWIVPDNAQLSRFKPLLYRTGLTLADAGIYQDDRMLEHFYIELLLKTAEKLNPAKLGLTFVIIILIQNRSQY